MRRKCVNLDARKFLIADIGQSAQRADLSTPPNCEGLGRIRHFSSIADGAWLPNFLPGVPAARWLNRQPNEIEIAQVFQLAGCPLRCWYCFVPYQLLDGNARSARWQSVDDLLDMFIRLPDRPSIVDLSGGSPEIAPEWPAWFAEALIDRGLQQSVYLWSDDSLTTDLLLTSEMRPILKTLEEYPGYGRVCCIKGIDPITYAEATRDSEDGFDRQLRILEGYLGTGLDIYGYVTLLPPPTEKPRGAIELLLDRLQSVSPKFPERLVPLKLLPFGVTTQRVSADRMRALRAQDELIEIWKEVLAGRGLKYFPAEVRH